MKKYQIAVIPGDGVGKEIIPEGIKVLQAVANLEQFKLSIEVFPWGAEYYLQSGEFMPKDGLTHLKDFDAIYLGAIGHPDVDDSLPAKYCIFRIRKGFQQYINLRPVCLLSSVQGPLRDKDSKDINFVIVRENTEGEFAEAGSMVNPDQPGGLALQISVFTRQGIERVAHYAFALARTRRGKVTNVTKSNALYFGLRYWDRVIEEVHHSYPYVEYEKLHADAAAASFIRHPERLDVILTTNMFGDILSDLGGALMGGLGLAPSGNINPERMFPSMFEPIHGSAPSIAGRGIANPVGAIWAGAMMLEYLGENDAAQRILKSVNSVLRDGPRPVDLGGQATTVEIGNAVIQRLAHTNIK